jgi:hypothetical protein
VTRVEELMAATAEERRAAFAAPYARLKAHASEGGDDQLLAYLARTAEAVKWSQSIAVAALEEAVARLDALPDGMRGIGMIAPKQSGLARGEPEGRAQLASAVEAFAAPPQPPPAPARPGLPPPRPLPTQQPRSKP